MISYHKKTRIMIINVVDGDYKKGCAFFSFFFCLHLLLQTTLSFLGATVLAPVMTLRLDSSTVHDSIKAQGQLW